MAENFNLWGDPEDPPGETRGRPAHVPTDVRRRRVAWLRSLNFTDAMIATAFGISEPTLRKHYRVELANGRAQKRAEVLVALGEKATAGAGNVAAMKAFLREVERADTLPLRDAAPKPSRIGKKEQAALDAARPDPNSSMGELLLKRAATGALH